MKKIITQFFFICAILIAAMVGPTDAFALTLNDLPFDTSAFQSPQSIVSELTLSKDRAQDVQYLAAIIDENTSNRYELLAHELPDITYAEALLAAFSEEMTKSNFAPAGKPKEDTINVKDGTTIIKGRHSEYVYIGQKDDAKIHVEMFAFVMQSKACILVGYYNPEEETIKKGEEIFKKILVSFAKKEK